MTPADDETDRQLVSRLVRHRDERAFAALYDRHTTYLYRFALRLTAGDEDASADLVHDAWLRAVPRLSSFEWRSQLRTWLSGFVHGVWRERQRDDGRHTDLTDAIPTDIPPWDHVPSRVDLERALAQLPPGFREVLVLHDIEGYTHVDIATLLGVQPGTSKSQLSRARAAMRRALSDPET